ncbi:DUF5130 family protein [Nocardia brasiliensis]|uniref:DUF5130 family protein n=1 Tax=Nocardia brasiliensis TaxID=37326 RepID=UPI002456F421|nr:DUF5130 family protein [Nocardia brasiliensis]
MASSKWPAVVEADLPHGYVVTSSGRVSGVHEAGDVFKEAPFSDDERLAIDNVLTEATRATKVRFNIFIGDLGTDPAAGADAIFPSTPEAPTSVLIAVSPNDKAIEVRSGRGGGPPAAHPRGPRGGHPPRRGVRRGPRGGRGAAVATADNLRA